MRAHAISQLRRAAVGARAGTLPGVTSRAVALAGLQRSAGNAAVARLLRSQDEAAGHKVRAVLASPGRPLDGAVRADAEDHLGVDLSQVRVHDDGVADDAVRAVQAEAFASGSHVVLGAGAHETASNAGRRRLMHELTHVAQQQAGPVDGRVTAGGLRISEPGDVFERAADQSAATWAGEPAIQRHEDRPRVGRGGAG